MCLHITGEDFLSVISLTVMEGRQRKDPETNLCFPAPLAVFQCANNSGLLDHLRVQLTLAFTPSGFPVKINALTEAAS